MLCNMLNNTKFHCPSAAPLLGPTVALALIEISQDLLTTMVVSHCSHFAFQHTFWDPAPAHKTYNLLYNMSYRMLN